MGIYEYENIDFTGKRNNDVANYNRAKNIIQITEFPNRMKPTVFVVAWTRARFAY